MNNLLSSLNEVCQQYPLQEKILIVPGYSVGHELCEALARVSGGWVNLHPETTAGLAHQIAGGYLAEKNMTLLTGYLSAAVIEEVFQELEGKKVLQYFAREGSSPVGMCSFMRILKVLHHFPLQRRSSCCAVRASVGEGAVTSC